MGGVGSLEENTIPIINPELQQITDEVNVEIAAQSAASSSISPFLNKEDSILLAGNPVAYEQLLMGTSGPSNAIRYYSYESPVQIIQQIPAWAKTSDTVLDGYKQISTAEVIDDTRGYFIVNHGQAIIIHDRSSQASNQPRTWGSDGASARVAIKLLPRKFQPMIDGAVCYAYFTVAIFEPRLESWYVLATRPNQNDLVVAEDPGGDTSIGWDAQVPVEYPDFNINNSGIYRHWFYFSRQAGDKYGGCKPIDLATQPWWSMWSQTAYLCNPRPDAGKYGKSLANGEYNSMLMWTDGSRIPFMYVPDTDFTNRFYRRLKEICESVALQKQFIMQRPSDPVDIQIAKSMGIYGSRTAEEYAKCDADSKLDLCFWTRHSSTVMAKYCAANASDKACATTQAELNKQWAAIFTSPAAAQYKDTMMKNLKCWNNSYSRGEGFLFKDILPLLGNNCVESLGCDMTDDEQKNWGSSQECQRIKSANESAARAKKQAIDSKMASYNEWDTYIDQLLEAAATHAQNIEAGNYSITNPYHAGLSKKLAELSTFLQTTHDFLSVEEAEQEAAQVAEDIRIVGQTIARHNNLQDVKINAPPQLNGPSVLPPTVDAPQQQPPNNEDLIDSNDIDDAEDDEDLIDSNDVEDAENTITNKLQLFISGTDAEENIWRTILIIVVAVVVIGGGIWIFVKKKETTGGPDTYLSGEPGEITNSDEK